MPEIALPNHSRHSSSPESISIIVPTYQEAANIPELISRIESVKNENSLDLELLIMDDDSADGTVEVVQNANRDWVKLTVRTGDRGLSLAVLDGLHRATGDQLVVMDADLSHPPEKIPELLSALDNGFDFVIGSRYVAGGETAEDWSLFRYLNSKVATLFARPFTRARDPMSGFFAMTRAKFQGAQDLNPIGYKIGLELIVKADCKKIGEIPIYFANRKHGESKLSFKEQLKYIQHIRRLFIYKFPNWSYILQFLVVGASGTVVNLAVLTLLESGFGMPARGAIAGGIIASVISNFFLNRRFTFSYAKNESLIPQFLGFLAVSFLGIVVNYFVSVYTLEHVLPPSFKFSQIAAMIGIIAGLLINFLLNRFFVFKKKK